MYNLTTDKKFSSSTFMSERASQSLLTMKTQRELVILLQLDIGPPQACCQTHVMGLLICWSFRGGSESSRLCTDSGQCSGFRRTQRAFLKLTAKSWSIRDKCKQKLILRFSPYYSILLRMHTVRPTPFWL